MNSALKWVGEHVTTNQATGNAGDAAAHSHGARAPLVVSNACSNLCGNGDRDRAWDVQLNNTLWKSCAIPEHDL